MNYSSAGPGIKRARDGITFKSATSPERHHCGRRPLHQVDSSANKGRVNAGRLKVRARLSTTVVANKLDNERFDRVFRRKSQPRVE